MQRSCALLYHIHIRAHKYCSDNWIIALLLVKYAEVLGKHFSLHLLIQHTYCTPHSAVVHVPRRPPPPAVYWHDYTLRAAIAFTAVHVLIWLCKASAVLLQLARRSRARRAAAVKANSRSSSANGNSNGTSDGHVNGGVVHATAAAAGAAATANSAAVNNGDVVQAP
jgi:hypothetical protein